MQVLFIGHIILHNNNKKISIELKEGIFMSVTNNIREIREQRGIYHNDLAAAIGYSTKTVGRIEMCIRDRYKKYQDCGDREVSHH